MVVELLAIGCLFAWSVGSFIFGIKQYQKEKDELLEKFNIEELKQDFIEIVDERLQAAIDSIGEAFQAILTDPTVKKAFGIIGSQGGEARAENLAVDEMARDIIDGPQFEAIKMGAEMLGIDVDAYVDKHGAMKTMRAAQTLGKFAGIDIMNLNLGSLALPGGSGPSNNPYFRR